MSPVSRGFRHLRRASDEDAAWVPPGQYVTEGFPVLSAGPTPHTSLEKWTLSITQGGQTRKSWTWQEFRALPAETVTADIHCVTRWSKLDTVWQGVSIDTPRHWVPSLDQRVTQWRSAVMVSADSARNSCQVQDFLVWPP